MINHFNTTIFSIESHLRLFIIPIVSTYLAYQFGLKAFRPSEIKVNIPVPKLGKYKKYGKWKQNIKPDDVESKNQIGIHSNLEYVKFSYIY